MVFGKFVWFAWVWFGYVCCINWKSLRYFTWISDAIECILFASNNRSIERCFRCYTRSIATATFSRLWSLTYHKLCDFVNHFIKLKKKQLTVAFYVIVMSSFKYVSIGIEFCWSIDICDIWFNKLRIVHPISKGKLFVNGKIPIQLLTLYPFMHHRLWITGGWMILNTFDWIPIINY